jgi:hypothetical protein
LIRQQRQRQDGVGARRCGARSRSRLGAIRDGNDWHARGLLVASQQLGKRTAVDERQMHARDHDLRRRPKSFHESVAAVGSLVNAPPCGAEAACAQRSRLGIGICH